MVNFSNGKIYKIYNDKECYIDSTTSKYLSDVLSKWKHKFNAFKNGKMNMKYHQVFDIFIGCSGKSVQIDLIEEYACENKHQLSNRKNNWIEKMLCINNITKSQYSKDEYKYECNCCNYRCYYKGDFNKHQKSKKHLKNHDLYLKKLKDEIQNGYDSDNNDEENIDINTLHTINKNDRRSQVNHDSQSYDEERNVVDNNPKIDINEFKKLLQKVNFDFNKNNMIHLQNHDEIIRQNNELKREIEEIKNLSSNNKSVNIVQNNFNVMNYLNNECNNAPNIYQFINDLPINIENCKNIANHGFLESFQETFVKALNDCEQNMRPIHCTDVKRNTCYIKNADNLWVRDSQEHDELYNVFDHFQNKHLMIFKKHKDKVQNWMDDDENLDFFNTFITNINEMHRKKSGEGPKLFKKLINCTLKNNKLLKD